MKQVLQVFFWVAFASFLSASIPHVAFFFRAYEPQAPGQDVLYWLISYAIAMSIDITIFLLSVTVAQLQQRAHAPGLIASVWVFILALALLSWYINYKYAELFQSALISATPLTVPFVGTIRDINPLIASCFQVLAIAYTWMSDKIAANQLPKTAAQLQAEAEELEQMAREQARILAAKNQQRAHRFHSFVGLAHEMKQAVVTSSKRGEKTAEKTPEPDNNATNGLTNDLTKGRATESAGKTASIEQDIAGSSAGGEELVSGEKKPADADAQADVPGRGTSSFTEVAQLLGRSERSVAYLVKTGGLKVAPRNKKRILNASVKTYLETRGKTTGKEESKAQGSPTSPSGDEKYQKTMEYLAKHPSATDAMLAEYLGLARPAAARFWRVVVTENHQDNGDANETHGNRLGEGTSLEQPEARELE